jgi:hypothetical protein
VTPAIRASIPALQRGLVWKPQQNELLWDSILRGFPIGAIVVSRWSEKLKKTVEGTGEGITHHLLDGQQRCHAIALGFTDPFADDRTAEKEAETILWLDLNPTYDRNSTRNFLVRATTTAHPWGYRKDDAATPLTAWAIREALKPLNLNAADPEYRRPSPQALWPCAAAATTPVPLAWLLRLETADETVFWQELEKRAAATNLVWAEKVREFCLEPTNAESRGRIFRGIIRAHSAKLIALEAPEELLETSEQERAAGSEAHDVSNIEQLFQRLNSQGTKLDGEELAYSMIKAYWPDLEEPINEVSERRMPQARMVSLGVRAALVNTENRNLPAIPTVSSLRQIARTEKDRKALIESFITEDLHLACRRVDAWLKYDKEMNPSGLLPVHVTSVALNSREIYLLLLHFAARSCRIELPSDWQKTMQALATVLHWFAVDKTKAVNRIYAECREEVSLARIRTALHDAVEAGELSEIHSPEAVESFVSIPTENFKDWNWWRPIHGNGVAEEIQVRRQSWERFLNFRSNRDLLLYAQRHFLAQRFRDYDPARRDLWEAHNRPWDFDHILASYYFYNRKDGSPFREVCGQWG